MGCFPSRPAAGPPDSPAAWARALSTTPSGRPLALPPHAPARPAPARALDCDKLHVDTVAGVTFVNQYVVAGGLGRGAHGAVRAAVDSTTGALVALKVAPRFGRADKAALLAAGGRRAGAAVARGPPPPGVAAREAALLRGLAAAGVPGVVRLIEYVDDPRCERVLLVLEFAAGGAVGRAAAPERASAGRVARVGATVAATLAAMHAAGVAHGDVKPDNILDDGGGGVMLADLGSARPAGGCGADGAPPPPPSHLAALVAASTHAAHPGGGSTHAFAPPEACGLTPRGGGAAATGAAADVWALGVTLHSLAYGVLPFGGAPLDMCNRIVSGSPAGVPAAGEEGRRRRGEVDPSSPLAAAIAAALAKDPADRPSAADLASLIDRCERGASSSRAPPLAFPAAPRVVAAPRERLAVEGDPAAAALLVLAGSLDAVTAAGDADDLDGDGDEEFDGGASDDDAAAARAAAASAASTPPPTAVLLGRSHTVKETVTGATARASALVAGGCGGVGGGGVVASRGVGALVAEPPLLDAAAGGTAVDADAGPLFWRTSIVAGGDGATVAVVPFAALAAAAAAAADAADAVRAAAAARRADLLLAGALERVSALAHVLRRGSSCGGVEAACDAVLGDSL